MPWDIEKCVDYAFLKHVYYLNLHCDDETQDKRLRERNWTDDKIQQYKNFAKRLIEIADEVYSLPMPNSSCISKKEWVLR